MHKARLRTTIARAIISPTLNISLLLRLLSREDSSGWITIFRRWVPAVRAMTISNLDRWLRQTLSCDAIREANLAGSSSYPPNQAHLPACQLSIDQISRRNK